ncbi:MAG: hypothetical protein K6T88_00310 [Bacillus sp. (in: Bacteria)]|nr:hypothetical protein [Bacillus sp. (in: firmicutes)]
MNEVVSNGLLVSPTLAVKIGINEAIVLQLIEELMKKRTHVIKGKKWINRTYSELQEDLSFWSVSTIKRTIRSLEKQGYLDSAKWNATKYDMSKWYTINFEILEKSKW